MGHNQENNASNRRSVYDGSGARSTNSNRPATEMRGNGARNPGGRPPHPPKK